jgi:uncharacterized membrane protein YdjX (TVP38/TMEM64 family)
MDRIRSALERYGAPVIVGWSFLPIVPTDVMCYVCGLLRVSYPRFIAAVTLGEGAICAIYIYGGDQLLRVLHLR